MMVEVLTVLSDQFLAVALAALSECFLVEALAALLDL